MKNYFLENCLKICKILRKFSWDKCYFVWYRWNDFMSGFLLDCHKTSVFLQTGPDQVVNRFKSLNLDLLVENGHAHNAVDQKGFIVHLKKACYFSRWIFLQRCNSHKKDPLPLTMDVLRYALYSRTGPCN